MDASVVQTAGDPTFVANDEPRFGDHLRGVINTRGFVWSFVVAASAAFLVVAAKTGNSIKSLVAVLVVLAVWLVGAALRARSAAEVAFLQEYARQRGFKYIGEMQLLETTPLLAAGEKHWCEHYMEGPLGSDSPGVAFGLAHYTFETYEETNTRRDNTVEVRTPHHLTVCVVEVPEATELYPGIFMTRRRGVFKSVSSVSWLDYGQLRDVELESEAMHRRFDLYVRKAQDDNGLLRLFKPKFQQWLADLPSEIYWEYHLGTLVTYRFKHETTAVELDALIHTTAHIAREIRESVGAPPVAPAASGTPSPAG